MVKRQREMTPPKHYQATVVSNTRESSKVYVTKFRVDEPSWEFEAGQYASFILAPTLRRSLSFANPPNGAEFEVCADVKSKGAGYVWLNDLKIGETTDFIGPLGKFLVDKESARPKIFVATGTGIGPIRSMVYDALRHNETTDVWLYWGLRFEEDVFWHDEFLTLARRNKAFHYTLTLSKPGATWQGVDGRVTDHMFEQAQALKNFDFYLCGNRAMIHEVQEKLLTQEVPEEQIKTELFY